MIKVISLGECHIKTGTNLFQFHREGAVIHLLLHVWTWQSVFISIWLHASVSMPSPPPPLLISLTFYICTLLLDLFAPVPTPMSSKFLSVIARQKVIMLSLSLVLLSGIHCHCTLEMLQLLTPSSLLLKPMSSTSKNLISSYLLDLFCVSVCVMCVCVCGWEGERVRERECATDVIVHWCTDV